MKDKQMMRKLSKISILAFFILITVFEIEAQTKLSQKSEKLRIVFYNVENLFDTINSPKNDEEFLPSGNRSWGKYKYKRKLNNIAKVLVAVGDGQTPDIIGLCEVENGLVLSDLTKRTILQNSRYKFLYADSYDRRGIGVAILFNDKFELIESELLYPVAKQGDTLFTRTVLLSKLLFKSDTLNIFVAHWPSRRGGVAATDKLRMDVARLIDSKIKSLNNDGTEGKYHIIMGDLNCNPDSEIFNHYLKGDVKNITKTQNSSSGTYKFRGRWDLFDQVFLGSEFFADSSSLKYVDESFRILNSQILLIEDNSFHGTKPFSTWSGPRYQGGYSDHLPVLFDLIYFY